MSTSPYDYENEKKQEQRCNSDALKVSKCVPAARGAHDRVTPSINALEQSVKVLMDMAVAGLGA